MKESVKQWLWLLLYFLILLAPLALVLAGPRPGGREFWREFSVALGFSGLALMGLQFIPTARLRPLTQLLPMDEVYFYHQRASVVAFLLILAHPLILFLFNPTSVRLLNPLTAPARADYGVVSLLALVGLLVTSIFRQQLNINYELWKVLHNLFALSAVVLVMLHILGVDYYLYDMV